MIWKQWKRGKARQEKLCQLGVDKKLAAQTAGSPLGPWRLVDSPALHYALPLPTLALSIFLDSSKGWRNPLNRPLRTRMSGGVAGESGRPLPLCRL
jgi:hypothetical protein